MKIHFLKEDALIALKANVSANLSKYRNPTNEWIYDYFQGEDPFLEANFECEDFQLVLSPDYNQISSTDIQNVRIIYSALKFLTDTQATDERLWAGLCHYEFWEYMHKRWDMAYEPKLNAQTILSRYYFSTGKRRSLSTNTISKLWWVGRWIYDPHRADPFELLKYFEVEFSTKLYILFSNTFMSNKNIAFGLLEALIYLEAIGYVLKNVDFTKQSNIRQIFLKASSFLNIYGGTHILDYFSKEEIKDKVIDYMLSLPHTASDDKRDTSKPVKKVQSVAHFPSIEALVAEQPISKPMKTVRQDQPAKEELKPQPVKEEPKPELESPNNSQNPLNQQQMTVEWTDADRGKVDAQVSIEDILQEPKPVVEKKRKKLTATEEDLVYYCENMRMSYSYKAVLLLALLEHIAVDGKIPLESAVMFFRSFYSIRMKQGLPAELKSSIYSDPDVDDSRIMRNIIQNPVNALQLSSFFEYDQEKNRFGFKKEVWEEVTKEGINQMREATKQRLEKYYKQM